MINQKGFGITFLFPIAIIALIFVAGWYIYSREQPTEPKSISPVAQKYIFTPLEIDTSKWLPFEPFQGFTLHYPADWKLVDSGNFVTVGMRATGLIADTRVVNVTSKDTYFFTKDLEIIADSNGYKQDRKSGEISKGARIRLNMSALKNDNQASSAGDTCSYYKHQKTEILKFDTYQVCQVQIANDNGNIIYGYDFHVNTDKVGYFLAISFSTNATEDQKDYYTTVARQMVTSYKLY